jgi:GNAT superfamily N-acetyltransferase
MVAIAAGWNPERPFTAQEVIDTHELVHYVEDWPRPGELGVVAELAGAPVGACWIRYLPGTDPGYGYVADDIPELIIGIESVYRRQGLGRKMIRAVATLAHRSGVSRISLSVEHGNGAVYLYESERFESLVRRDEGVTMVRSL